MRLLRIALAAWGFSTGAWAQDQVLFRPSADQVLVEYRFHTPTTGFDFDTQVPPAARVESADSEVSLSRTGLSFTGPRDHFILTLRPDRVRTDATYPVLTRLGAGWMIYLPSLVNRKPGALLPETISVADGWAVIAGPAQAMFDGFIYVGPSDERRDPDDIIADPSLPVWLVDDIRSAAEASNAYYGARLKLPAPGAPVVLVSPLPAEDRASYVGDVTPNGVINLQFASGGVPADRDQRFTDMVQPFVAHEVFHNWQGGRQRNIDGVNTRWLDEGAAEYFSLLAGASLSPEAALRSRSILANRLGACLEKMQDQQTGLLALETVAAESTRYDCGTVVQWLVDVATADQGGVWRVWRPLLVSKNGYSVSDFLALAAPSGVNAGLSALLEGGPDVRGEVVASLADHVQLAQPTPSAWAVAAIWPLLETSCTGQRGVMTTEDGRWVLDTGNRCGALSGDPELLGVRENRFADAGRKAFDAVAAACDAKEEVEAILKFGGEIRWVPVRCASPIKRPAPAYEVLVLP